MGAIYWHHNSMKRKHLKTLELIYGHPQSANVKWSDIEALFKTLGAEITEREGSRIGVRLFGERRVFHRPHPSPDTDKGAIAGIRKWFEENEVKP
jgi:HicA toxin of bacterial toxin-antitoxin,